MNKLFDFWYSERCTRQFKLISCMSTCCIIFFSSKSVSLSTSRIIMAILTGLLIHAIYHAQKKLKPNYLYKTGFDVLFFIVPILIIIGFITTLPKVGQLLLSIQNIGFVAIGFFLVSIYSQRAKRS